MIGRWLGATLAILVLAGCAGPAGSRHITCHQACERDYDMCAESAGASRGGASFFGVGAACQRELSACFKACEAAAVQAEAAKKPVGKAAPGEPTKAPGAP